MELVFDEAVRCAYVNQRIEDAEGRGCDLEVFYAEHPVARRMDRLIRKGFRFEWGRFRIEGVKGVEPIVGEYCFWAKDLVAQILSPREFADIRYSLHQPYMVPTTFWAYDIQRTLQDKMIGLLLEKLSQG